MGWGSRVDVMICYFCLPGRFAPALAAGLGLGLFGPIGLGLLWFLAFLVATFGGLVDGLDYCGPDSRDHGEMHATDEQLTQELETSHKSAQGTCNAEMANGHADVEPRAFISHHVKEVERHNVRDGHDDHEKRAGRDLQATVENA